MTGDESLDRETAFAEIRRMMEDGEFSLDISCVEMRIRWFEMARSIFVYESRDPLPADFELGYHMGMCTSVVCMELWHVYKELLRDSKPEDAPALAIAIDELEIRLAAIGN